MEGLPVLGSQGWAAKCEAGSADQRPEPAKAGPPVTMRLEFKPFVAQPDGCIRAKSASSLLSLVVGEARERERRSKCYCVAGGAQGYGPVCRTSVFAMMEVVNITSRIKHPISPSFWSSHRFAAIHQNCPAANSGSARQPMLPNSALLTAPARLVPAATLGWM